MIKSICIPALIYFIYSFTQVILDFGIGYFNLAIMKLVVSIIFTLLLNSLCGAGLTVVSWFIILVPFVLMSIIVSLILITVGLDPITGSKVKTI